MKDSDHGHARTRDRVKVQEPGQEWEADLVRARAEEVGYPRIRREGREGTMRDITEKTTGGWALLPDSNSNETGGVGELKNCRKRGLKQG